MAYLGVQSTPELRATRDGLIQLMGKDKHRLFTPHLTLAMRLKPAQMQAMVAELKESEWENGRYTTPIHELCLMQRVPDDAVWRTILQIPL